METGNNNSNEEELFWGTPYQSSYSTAVKSSVNLSKAEFCKHYASADIRKTLLAVAIATYIFAGLNFLFAIFLDLFILVDVIILLVLGLGLHFKKSFVCAIILTVEASLGMIVGVISMGRATGIGILVTGIYAIIYTSRLNKEYKEYVAMH